MATGAITLAATSPFFITNLIKSYSRFKKFPKGKLRSTFYNLRKTGDIEIGTRGKQIYISLSAKGRAKAGIFQIDALRVIRPGRWDGIWRIITFDIGELRRIEREAFRGKLKQLGFYMLQKSVWVHAYDCSAEIYILKDFFGLSNDEMRLIKTKDIGEDMMVRKYFDIK